MISWPGRTKAFDGAQRGIVEVTNTPLCLQVNTVLAEELKSVHALAIKKCLTPEQQAALQPPK